MVSVVNPAVIHAYAGVQLARSKTARRGITTAGMKQYLAFMKAYMPSANVHDGYYTNGYNRSDHSASAKDPVVSVLTIGQPLSIRSAIVES